MSVKLFRRAAQIYQTVKIIVWCAEVGYRFVQKRKRRHRRHRRYLY